jgi:hypothetical protein
VQHHFGDKAGLIRAILADRVARIEHVRAMQLAVLDDGRPPDPKQVLKVVWISPMSIKDKNGGHPFCRFMLQYMLHPRLTRHPLAAVYMFPFGPEGEADMPSNVADQPLGGLEVGGVVIRAGCGRRSSRVLRVELASRPPQSIGGVEQRQLGCVYNSRVRSCCHRRDPCFPAGPAQSIRESHARRE